LKRKDKKETYTIVEYFLLIKWNINYRKCGSKGRKYIIIYICKNILNVGGKEV